MKYAQFEVTAAYDDTPKKPKISPDYTAPIHPAERRSAGTYSPMPAQIRPQGDTRINDIHVKEITERVDVEKLLDDIKDLKRSVQALADNAVASDMGGLPRHLAELLKHLLDEGFEEKIAKGLTRQLLNELTGPELNNRAVILARAIELLKKNMGDVCPIVIAGSRPRMVAFVGPTGTGKTTTIAKLATEFSLNQKKNVSVLTIDTKRIDAVGQLKSYCRIINIPLYIAYSPEELPGIMPKLMTSDIILIDTPGAGPMDKPLMLEMVEFLQRLVPQEVHLTMSVTTSLREMQRIAKHFNTLKPNRVLFTKLDETDSCGQMFSFAIMSKKPMSYVTFGQNVPGDFAPANPEALLKQSFSKEQSE
jgi:flagellar biosynthesis protein FlhF